MLDDLARWKLPVRMHGGDLVVELDGTGLCVFSLPLLVGRAVQATLRFDDTDPPVWRRCPVRACDYDCPDIRWELLAAADWHLTLGDLASLDAANVTHIDTGVVAVPMPGERRWVAAPGSGKPLPSLSAVATAVRIMSLQTGDHCIQFDQKGAAMIPLTALTPANLAMVLLVRQDDRSATMPTIKLTEIPAMIRKLHSAGVPAVKLFASGGARDRTGAGGLASNGLMTNAIDAVKSAAPEMVTMTETCLCSHTATGECYPPDADGRPDHAAAVDMIAAQAVVQAHAGADVVGPAAMIPGSVVAVRKALDDTGFSRVRIMPHVIWDSRLYDGYRQTMEAVPASGEHRAFQLDPRDPRAALAVSLGFVAEGADMLLLEPALTCADLLIQLRQVSGVPLSPFSVSGEYQRLRHREDLRLLVELFTMLLRAGADQIITYAAADLAETVALG